MSKRALFIVLVGLGLVVVGTPTAAFAHVTVNPGEANQGGFTKLTFRVPNERDDSGTSSVQINLPDDVVIRSVSVKPVPGWEAAIERRTLDDPIETDSGEEVTEVVSKITWTGGVIQPGQFQEFDVSVGPLPDRVDQVTFPAIQTYESGEVVRWIEEIPESGEEPEHPVPTLTLLPSTGDDHDDGTEAEEADEADEVAAASDGDSDEDGTGGVAVAALIVGIVGVLLGGTALVRRRS
ncbi:MAG: YcnI family copper-binding membrane protein [Actinomycetota bacterium]